MSTTPAISPRRHAFFPDDEGPLGLLFAETPTGKRVTVLVDGAWLCRRLAADPELAAPVPDHASLPVVAPGWPERWGPGDCRLIDVVAADLAAGATWAEVRESVTAAARPQTDPGDVDIRDALHRTEPTLLRPR